MTKLFSGYSGISQGEPPPNKKVFIIKLKYFTECEDTCVGFVLFSRKTITEEMYDSDLISKLAATVMQPKNMYIIKSIMFH